MNNPLCICIPTHNRINKLRKSISHHAKLCIRHNLLLVVSDNASSDQTRELLVKLKEQYEWFDFIIQPKNIGPDANFNFVLKMGLKTGADYLWLVGDDDLIQPDALQTILKRLCVESPDLMIVNTRNQVKKELPSSYTSPSNLLKDLSWHTTFISSLIFGAEAAIHGIKGNNLSRNFGHVFGVFTFLADQPIINVSWEQKISITTIRLDNSLPSWFGSILDIFVSNWIKTINCLPSEYSDEDKRIAIRSLWSQSSILNPKTIVFLIFRSDINLKEFLSKKPELKLVIGSQWFYFLIPAFLVPKFLSRKIAKFALNLYFKKRSNESSNFEKL